jgi:hypothetical protein
MMLFLYFVGGDRNIQASSEIAVEKLGRINVYAVERQE